MGYIRYKDIMDFFGKFSHVDDRFDNLEIWGVNTHHWNICLLVYHCFRRGMIPSKLIVINWAIVEKMELCALVNHRHVCLCCLNVPIRYESRAFFNGISGKSEHIFSNRSFALLSSFIHNPFCMHGAKSLSWSRNKAWARKWLMQIKLALEEALSNPTINKYCWIHAS